MLNLENVKCTREGIPVFGLRKKRDLVGLLMGSCNITGFIVDVPFKWTGEGRTIPHMYPDPARLVEWGDIDDDAHLRFLGCMKILSTWKEDDWSSPVIRQEFLNRVRGDQEFYIKRLEKAESEGLIDPVKKESFAPRVVRVDT